METGEFVYGLLDSSAAIGNRELAAKCRDLTLCWSRYDYHGPIIESDSVDEILSRAVELGYRYCFILACGMIIHECWKACGQDDDFPTLLSSVLRNLGGKVGGNLVPDTHPELLDYRCLIVDLHEHTTLGSPAFGKGSCGAVPDGMSVRVLPQALRDHIVDLAPEVAGPTADILARNAEPVAREAELARLSGPHQRLLRAIATQVGNARRGVFLLNVEPYRDVECPPHGFAGPVSNLYCVASGFKPNRILQTHGMTEDTRVVFFDYSREALSIRRVMIEEWDGTSFPSFMRTLFERFPPPDTYYQLWAGATPDTLNWPTAEHVWQAQLQQLGGAEAFREHWQLYRQLAHEYVHCDILADPQPLLRRILPVPGSVMWFSNAPFTMSANWRYSTDERRRMYTEWLRQLTDTNPGMILYGSDYANSNVNRIAAVDYRERYQQEDHGILDPCRLQNIEIRM